MIHEVLYTFCFCIIQGTLITCLPQLNPWAPAILLAIAMSLSYIRGFNDALRGAIQSVKIISQQLKKGKENKG